ncbi:MAG: glycosyltransferase family 4 protein [Deferrisomatales bacterium]|nr:glycosyltransferase family 4 protein [Deferrisomatales bacterium]
MNILVVAPQPFFTPRGTPFSVYYRTQVLCELGHRVDLLTYGQGADVEIPGCRVVRIPAFRALGPVRVGPSLLKLFLDGFLLLWTVGLLLSRRHEVVHAHEEAVFWCRWLKPIFGFRLIYDMHSSLPQQLHNFQFTRLRLVHWLFETLERSAVRAAEAVIVVCPALLAQARGLTADHGKIFLIENSLSDPVRLAGEPAGGDHGVRGEELAAAERWIDGRGRDAVVAYAGTLEAYQGIDRLLEAFSAVRREMPAAGLLIVGGMPREVEHFRRLADTLGLGEAVHFTGQVTQQEAQRLVALAAVGISMRLTGTNTPMKIYQLMADGVPLVATRIESHTQVLNDGISILADTTPEALAEAILRALREPEAALGLAARAKEWYGEHYSREAYTAKMAKLLSLVSREPAPQSRRGAPSARAGSPEHEPISAGSQGRRECRAKGAGCGAD